MTTAAEEPPAPSRRPLRRAFRLLLGALLALEAVYVAGGLILVESGQVGRWINKNPDKLRITFDSVLPVVPGVVRVRGFRIVNQGRADQLVGTVDVVWGAVNPLELLARRVHVVWLRCRGVGFRLRSRPKTAEEAASLPAGFPAIDGVAWVPFEGPPPGPPKPKDGMTIVFTRARLRDVREVWIGQRRLSGDGRVVASVTVHGDGRIAIPHADVRFENARFENGAEETFKGVRLAVLGALPAFQPDEAKGLGIISLLRARVDLDARMPSGAAYLNVYLRNAPWVRFTGGEADLTAHLAVHEGSLAPGGVLELSAGELQADFAGFTAKGTARTRLEVVPATGAPPVARLSVEFDRYDLRRAKAAKEPLVLGEGLRVTLSTPATLSQIPPTELGGRLELGRAELPRLAFLNELFPGGGGFRVAGGAAKVEAAFDVAEGGSSCRGSMKVTGKGLSVDAGGVAMKGALSLVVSIPKGDFLKTAFDVDGTRLTLDRFTFASKNEAASAPDWSASVAFPKARLTLGDAFGAAGQVELRASDSRPVVAFLSKDAPLKGWKKKLVTVGEIKGGSRFSLSGGTLALEDFFVGWEGTEVKARVRLTDKGSFGKALVRVGVLKAGIELAGEERDLHILRPESWYEKR